MRVCAECTTRYAAGAPRCPHCSSTEWVEEGAAGAVPPVVMVECSPGRGCRYQGRRRQVVLRLAAVGVVELPTLLCAACGGALLITWPAPASEEDNDMPKITRHGGATNAAETAAELRGEHGPELPDLPTDDEDRQAPDEGGEQSSPGTNSSTSSPKPAKSSAPSDSDRPKPARTTGNRSAKGRTASSSARSTAGGQTEPTSGSADES